MSSGDEIYGEIVGTNCTSAGQCTWAITTTDKTTGQSTTLTTDDDDQSYVLLFGGVLESYGIQGCDDYPVNGKATFTGVNFYDGQNKPLLPDWYSQFDDRSYCNLAIHAVGTTTELDFTNSHGAARDLR